VAREKLAPAAFSPPLSIRLLILQPTPFCNISCDYCYLAGRDERRFMSPLVAEASVANAARSGLLGRKLSAVWHAGEPLVAPTDFYVEAFDRMHAAAGREVTVEHSIQTNGMLIDDRWCDLFKHHSVRVGVSLDGPASLHDRHRKTRGGKPTHAQVMRGIDALRRRSVPFHVIVVVTRDSLDHADAIADFFLANDISDIGVNVDEQEGVNASSSLDAEDNRYRTFLARLFERASEVPDRLRVREFQRAVDLVLNGLPKVSLDGDPLPDNAQVLPFAITTVDWAGRFSCFSPELIDQTHPRYGDFTFGNVLHDPMIDALKCEKFQRVFSDILSGVRACAATCEYFQLCGGGAPVNKLNETGSFASDVTNYCRRTVQQPIAIALDHVERSLALS
jgi:uncharacterized protein